MAEAGRLYVVATPIGNLEDITPRALKALGAVARIAAEDTRRTRQLLTHFGISPRALESLHAHSSPREIARLVDALQSGEDIAFVTDAGTPLVSDPGDALVRAAIEAGITVVPVPGASAVLAALMASGLVGGAFRFLGFLPRDGSTRREAIARVCDTPETVVLFEAANRTNATLTDLADATPDRTACVARELTKVHEEFLRGTLRELVALNHAWIGEVVLVLGPHEVSAREGAIDDAALDEKIDIALAQGEHSRAIAERLAAWSGRPKRQVYGRVIARKQRLEG
ncbi:16S rRNA (cytidine(1402)-2'-O)-methyltransferase [Pendulispora brunnea]|uniref:Ribosomal RNA small subunit methyltransferase I n=1 Tax=Pendulispora brunnea TaxID=2905690 RepID=A0ABZ2K6K0_9BACT